MPTSAKYVKSSIVRSDAEQAITWLGHATALLELDGIRVLTDPVLRDRVGPLVRIARSVPGVGTVDCVLLSHLHADHADLPSLRDLGAPVIAPVGAGAWLQRNGLPDARELSPGRETTVAGVTIRATPAVHARRRRPLGAQADAIGYITRGSISIYFAGDTDLFEEMAALRGTIDVALLPVWGWGTRLGPGHLDPERAAKAAAMIQPRIAIPIHWGTFAMRRPAGRLADPSLPARQFVTLTAQRAPGVQVALLQPGERVAL